MANVRLDRTNCTVLFSIGLLTKRLANGCHFDWIANVCSCSMSFDVTNAIGADLAHPLGHRDDFRLTIDRRP